MDRFFIHYRISEARRKKAEQSKSDNNKQDTKQDTKQDNKQDNKLNQDTYDYTIEWLYKSINNF